MLAAPSNKGGMWVCMYTDVHTLHSSWLCPGHLCLHAIVIGAFHATLQVSCALAPSVALSSGEQLWVLLSASPELCAPAGQGFGASFPLFWNGAQQLSSKYVEKVSLKEGFLPCHSLLTTPSQTRGRCRGNATTKSLCFPESERSKWACQALWGPGDRMEVSWATCPPYKRPPLISLKGVGAVPCSYWDLFDVILHAIQSSVCHKNTTNPPCSHFTFGETTNVYLDYIRGEASGCSGSMARPRRQCSAVRRKWKAPWPDALCTCVFIKKRKTWESH